MIELEPKIAFSNFCDGLNTRGAHGTQTKGHVVLFSSLGQNFAGFRPYIEKTAVGSDIITGAERGDDLPVVVVSPSTETLTVPESVVQDTYSYALNKHPANSGELQLIPYRDEADVMSLVRINSVDSLERDRLMEVTQVELENEALREEVLVLTTKLQALTQPVRPEADMIELPPEKAQANRSNVAIAWIENQPWYIASLLAVLVVFVLEIEPVNFLKA